MLGNNHFAGSNGVQEAQATHVGNEFRGLHIPYDDQILRMMGYILNGKPPNYNHVFHSIFQQPF